MLYSNFGVQCTKNPEFVKKTLKQSINLNNNVF